MKSVSKRAGVPLAHAKHHLTLCFISVSFCLFIQPFIQPFKFYQESEPRFSQGIMDKTAKEGWKDFPEGSVRSVHLDASQRRIPPDPWLSELQTGGPCSGHPKWVDIGAEQGPQNLWWMSASLSPEWPWRVQKELQELWAVCLWPGQPFTQCCPSVLWEPRLAFC